MRLDKEIVIIGGGPAGLAAAIEAAELGAKVLVIDENKRPGGQLFKQIHKFFGSRDHAAGVRGYDIGLRLLEDTKRLNVEVWLESAAVGLFSGHQVAVLKNGATETISAKKVLICTGAAENAVHFPGWTLPGVMGAGAAQTMANIHRVLPGRRVLMVGSGNVGVIVAYQMMQAGAEVAGIVEGLNKIGAYGVHAAKVARAGVPFFLEHTIVEAQGTNRVERAVIARIQNWKAVPGTERVVDVDAVLIAAGLRPLTELARMAGAKHAYIPGLGGWMPLHDGNMETTVPGLYVAGDTAGVEEASTAMDEGRLAGLAMAHSLNYIGEDVFIRRKRQVHARLEALRQGPFGQKRLEAKARLFCGEVE